ncbi:MAG: hypothetical protein NVSMB52_06210 [Chloroflexota bacterium]
MRRLPIIVLMLVGVAFGEPRLHVAARPQEPGRLSIHLSSIRMFSSQAGWGFAGGILLRTVDGGVGWTNVMPRGVHLRGRISVAFLGPSTAWLGVLGPGSDYTANHAVIYRTNDAGKSWQGVRVGVAGGLGPGRLTLSDRANGWLFLDEGVGAGQNPYVLLHTRDGGAHWVEIGRTGDDSAPGTQLPGCNCTTAITFRNSNEGWATGQPGAYTFRSWLYMTHDAGHTWRRQPLVIPARFERAMTEAPLFFGAGRGILPVLLDTAYGLTSFEVFGTRNGGHTWSGTAPIALGLVSYSFIDSQRGWITDGARLFRTTDGGRHWILVTARVPLRQSSDGQGDIQFVNSSMGFALARHPSSPGLSLYRSTDGGQNWRAVSTYSLSKINA